MTRTCLAALLISVGLSSGARAQPIWHWGGGGVTFHGDYFRGLGHAAWGIGVGEYYEAMANSINADTAMRVNDYIMTALTMEAKDNAEHRAAILAGRLENYKKIRERILNAPEQGDVLDGAALNAMLDKLQAPDISDSTFHLYEVPIDAEFVQRIPFKLARKGEIISLKRLLLKAKGKWAVEFQDQRYDRVREAYLSAVDNALELAKEGNMQDSALVELKKALDNLKSRVRSDLDPMLYVDVKEQLDTLGSAIALFETHDVQAVLADIDNEPVMSVFQLKSFMQKHNITFAPTKTTDERKLYPQLYTALSEQRSKITGTGAGGEK
jgi:hypothetical protein